MTGLEFPDGWTTGDRRASVEVKARDFRQAVDLLNRIADEADRLDHHPDMAIENWNHVRISTWSHDVGSVTERDARLAAAIQRILDDSGLRPERK